MEYHATIEKTQGWWIGWLDDLPGVNAQERTQEELLESLKIGAEDLLDLKGIRDPNVVILVTGEPDADSDVDYRKRQDPDRTISNL
jgi:predicted RNase H-like HicB family nuclease